MTDKVKIKITLAYAEEHFGPRCKTYDHGCATCDGWKDYDDTGGYMLYGNDELLRQLDENWELMGMIADLQDELMALKGDDKRLPEKR